MNIIIRDLELETTRTTTKFREQKLLNELALINELISKLQQSFRCERA